MSLAPDNADALNILAADELKLGHADSAEAYLREALQKAPEQTQIYAKLAGLALVRKDLDGAEKVLKQGTDAVPGSVESWISLGRFYLFTHRISDAEDQFRKAVEVNPHSGAALLDLGRIQDERGKTYEAEKTFRSASVLPDKDYRPVHAIFLWQHDQKDAAIRVFAELAKSDTKDRAARTRLVTAYLAAKKKPEAMRVLAAALKKNPSDTDALVQRSEIYLDGGEVMEAQADVTKLFTLRPNDARVRYLLSRVYKLRNRESLRRQELSEALRLDPSLLAIRIELADTLATAPQSALDLMNATPEQQRHSLSAIAMRNWALLASRDFVEARKGIEEGLAQSKTPELMLQGAVLETQSASR